MAAKKSFRVTRVLKVYEEVIIEAKNEAEAEEIAESSEDVEWEEIDAVADNVTVEEEV